MQELTSPQSIRYALYNSVKFGLLMGNQFSMASTRKPHWIHPAYDSLAI